MKALVLFQTDYTKVSMTVHKKDGCLALVKPSAITRNNLEGKYIYVIFFGFNSRRFRNERNLVLSHFWIITRTTLLVIHYFVPTDDHTSQYKVRLALDFF